MKTRSNMWCEREKKPVLAVKPTHGARNTAAVLAAPATLGLSLLATKSERHWVCPSCGGPVVDMRHTNVYVRSTK